jgi:hypothetical protein
MTKRYREALDAVVLDGDDGDDDRDIRGPVGFRWRGRDYRVLQVLGHWREDPGWWRRPDGQPIRIEQTDLWRVEAGAGRGGNGAAGYNGHGRLAASPQGVYELVRRADVWTLDRVWD